MEAAVGISPPYLPAFHAVRPSMPSPPMPSRSAVVVIRQIQSVLVPTPSPCCLPPSLCYPPARNVTLQSAVAASNSTGTFTVRPCSSPLSGTKPSGT